MGNFQTEPEQVITVTLQALQESITTLKSELPSLNFKNPSPQLFKAIQIMNQQFKDHGLYEIKQDNQTYINPSYLRLFMDSNFESISQNWYKYWQKLLQELTQSKTILIKHQSWKFLSQFTRFLICFTSDRIFYIINNISVLSVHPDSKSVLNEYNSSNFDDQPKKHFISKLNRTEAQIIYKYLLIAMNTISSIKTSHVSSSDYVLIEITKFYEVYFSQNNHQELKKRAIKVNNQSIIQQIAYFLGYSIQTKNSSLFDIAIILAISIISGGKTNPNITNLPSHLFKYLPTSPSNNIYNFILQVILLSLTQKKNDPSHRFQCNRFNALRLCHYLLYSFATLNDITIDYIQNISAFTKMDHVQRVFIVYLIQQVNKTKQTDHLKKCYSRLNKPFELVLANTTLKYQCEQLIDYFRKHQQFLLQQMQTHYFDYLQQSILRKQRPKKQSRQFWERIINSKRQNRVTC